MFDSKTNVWAIKTPSEEEWRRTYAAKLEGGGNTRRHRAHRSVHA